MVGLDTFAHVAENCFATLTNDEDRKVFEVPPYIKAMVEKKLLGDKTKGGFYKRDKASGETSTLDPKTLEYRAKGGDPEIKATTKAPLRKIEDPNERLKKLDRRSRGKAGKFAWKVLSRSFAYSARRIPEIAGSVVAIDDAMKWGYGWEVGPLEAWDALGFVETTDRMVKDGVALPASIAKMKDAGAKGFYRGEGAKQEVWDFTKNALRGAGD